MPCTVRSKTKWPNWFNVQVDGANSQRRRVRIEEDGEGKVWKRLVNEAQSAAHDTNKHSNASTKGAHVGKVGSWALGARITTNFRGYGDYKGTLLRRVRNSANSAWQWVVCYNEDQVSTRTYKIDAFGSLVLLFVLICPLTYFFFSHLLHSTTY